MSQINDALKRAKKAQQDSPPPAHGPKLMPPDPTRQTTRDRGLLLPFVFVLVALPGLFLLWEIHQRSIAKTEPPAETKMVAVANTTPVPALQQATPVQPAPVATPPPAATAPPRAVPVAPVVPSPAPPPPVVKTPVAPVAPVVAAAKPAVTPALKLQAILFDARSSSALINGRMVSKGDKINEYLVASIGQSVVMLVNGQQTNVLKLNE